MPCPSPIGGGLFFFGDFEMEQISNCLLVELFTSLGTRSAKEIFMTAQTANRLAKIGVRTQRDLLYDIKNALLNYLQEHHHASLVLSVDHSPDRWGLESIALRSNPALRLHTHSNWLNKAAVKLRLDT